MFPRPSEAAEEYRKRIFPGRQPFLGVTDPEYVEMFETFLFDTVVNSDDLDDRTRSIAIVASLVGGNGLDAFRSMAPAALELGLTPVELKEIVYQASAYVGASGVIPFLSVTNEILKHRGVDLPLEPQARVPREERLEAGNDIQVEIFGEDMRRSWEQGPEETRHIREWLARDCFGNFYARNGLSLADRELATFCILAGLGGCAPQLVAHAKGNLAVGNDRALLIKATSQILPYIGFPRALNALRCIDEATEDQG